MDSHCDKLVYGKLKANSQKLFGHDLIYLKGFLPRLLVWNHRLEIKPLITSLEKVIDLYPYISGRIHGINSPDPTLYGSNKGVRFVCEERDEPLPFLCDNQPIDIHKYKGLKQLLLEVESDSFDEDTPLFQVKLSLFTNGSILATSICHGLADGAARFNLMSAWSDFARGLTPLPPELDRNMLRDDVLAEAIDSRPSYWYSSANIWSQDPEFICTSDVLRLEAEFISALVNDVHVSTRKMGFISRQDVIQAYVWKLLSKLGDKKDRGKSTIYFLYDYRKKIGLSRDYFGNACDGIILSKNDLENYSISRVAKFIRDSITCVSKDRVYADLCFLNADLLRKNPLKARKKGLRKPFNKTFIVANDTKFDYYNIDFGSGTPFWSCRAFPLPEKHHVPMLTIVESPLLDGAVDCHFVLPEPLLCKLRENWMTKAEG